MSRQDPAGHEEYRTQLAEEQLRLAQERTILSHIRTGFASFLFGTAVFGLFGDLETNVVGGLFVLVGVLFLLTGWLSYLKSNRRSRDLLDELESRFR